MIQRYRTRFAPSPTGKLHLGHARTALVAWLRARAMGGVFVLRLEDLDRPRNVQGAEQAIYDDLRWLGIDWDEGPDKGGPFVPYAQSERTELYEEAIDSLRARGYVYPCTCSRKELLTLASAPHGLDEEGPQYPGTCRNGPSRSDRIPALRFRMPRAQTFTDVLHGPLQVGRDDDDFVVRRADGLAAYQLSVVVDDSAMQITEVVRGDDLLSSTPRQIALYEALGARVPDFLHVPLVLGADGQRLSKRHAGITIAEHRTAGWSPEAMIGFLARSLGLGETRDGLSAAELVQRFDVKRIPHTPVTLPEGWPSLPDAEHGQR